MIRLLAVIAGVGFLMSVICIVGAVAIGGPDALAHGAWSWGPWSWSESDHEGSWNGHWTHMHGPQQTRDFAWSGASELIVDAPAEIQYVQAAGPPKLTISAPSAVLDEVRVNGGEITLEDTRPHFGRLHITLSAPTVDRFELRGAGELNIRDYKQEKLNIEVDGHGDVHAQGETRAVSLDISGAGDADLAQLHTAGAEISISGAGHATARPTDWAKLQIAGVGEINLLTRPPHLESHIAGAGQVHLPEPGAAGRSV